MREFNRLSHAYIADGEAADELAMAVVCSGICPDGSKQAGGGRPCGCCKDCKKAEQRIHPDITVLHRLRDKSGNFKREISVDQIREIKTDVYIAPNEAGKKAYVIDEAEKMNLNAQNALLQMLEEPPPHAVFILKTANPAKLLKTVRSRCAALKTQAGPSLDFCGQPEASQLAADFAAALGDNMLLTKCMFRLDKLDKSAFADFILLAREKMALALRENLHLQSAAHAEDLLTKAGEMLDLNVNVGHISAMICAGLLTTKEAEN